MWLEFELIHYNATIQHISNYFMLIVIFYVLFSLAHSPKIAYSTYFY